ncbi:hypothetical protein DCC39_14795 [Pueribacillus theae]|uniref:Uncharacterized protein n=1 Tax=Pueribacillus theae TaxID=2171751 RepID=A0A2U1JTH4_9BACI|nr:hypothetical protein [Pueribacillus theae]PWA08412.1 hypothetical protein DCC39_14795 [Pueribacillus theae]
MREYLIYCEDCKEYTILGKYIKKKKQYQGEYSLLYNDHIENDEILHRFIINHLGHPLKAVSSESKEYVEILRAGAHFMEDDIENLVAESIKEKQYEARDVAMERELGQLNFNILLKLFEEEANSLAKIATATSAESQFLLGKEEGIKKAMDILKDLMERTNALYS